MSKSSPRSQLEFDLCNSSSRVLAIQNDSDPFKLHISHRYRSRSISIEIASSILSFVCLGWLWPANIDIDAPGLQLLRIEQGRLRAADLDSGHESSSAAPSRSLQPISCAACLVLQPMRVLLERIRGELTGRHWSIHLHRRAAVRLRLALQCIRRLERRG